jgi:group I intron endonuclease
MTYIGQSVNIADRWRSHIKRGLGADTPTRNKLYPAMEKYGVENFSFEILEQCDKTQLDEKEKYWITFYQGMEFGYNMKRG